MTLVEARPTTPTYLNIPAFFSSGLYDLSGPTPIPFSETPVERNGSAELFSVGKHEKGKMFVYRPVNPNDLTVHFEHRFIHNPMIDLGNNHPNIPLLQSTYTQLDEREDTYINLDNYMNNPDHQKHRETQDFTKDYAGMISRIIDPSLGTLVHPRVFLEVGFDYLDPYGYPAKLPIDVFMITHGAYVLALEVASRKQEGKDEDLRRTKKYRQIVSQTDLARQQLPPGLKIIEGNIFYEAIGDNQSYVSLRFPQAIV